MKGRIEKKILDGGWESTDYSPEWEDDDKTAYVADLVEALPMIDPEKIKEIAMNSYDDHWGFGVEDVERDLRDELESMGIEYEGDDNDDAYSALSDVTSKWWNIGEDVDYDDEDEDIDDGAGNAEDEDATFDDEIEDDDDDDDYEFEDGDDNFEFDSTDPDDWESGKPGIRHDGTIDEDFLRRLKMSGVEIDDEDEFDDEDGEKIEESIKERIELRKQLNEHLFEAIDNNKLSEEFNNEKSPTNLVRYQLQKWSNGGTKMGEGIIDGEEGGPSAYEAWRAGVINKKREARVKQENADRNSPFASPRHTTQPKETFDGQEDQFLADWMRQKKQSMALNEKIEKFLRKV